MTLFRQLIIFTFVLFLVLFTGIWFAKLETTRAFLLDQLESHAQDTATSLALSVTQHMTDREMVIIESMINAVFDRGYYMVVRLTDVHGEVLTERVMDVTIESVPPWFIRWIDLETPEADAHVMAGWHQAGFLYVKSHPGYAYKTLWQSVVRTTLLFLVCGAVVLIAGGFGLRLLLRPLVMVERQADAICRKNYEIQESIPWTKEFRRVVEVMNRMTYKVKEMFEEQVAQAESLRERAYTDPVTGLGNRRYFESQVTSRLDGPDTPTKGILLLVKLNDLDRLNKDKGFQAGDDFLRRVAQLLQQTMGQNASCVLARLSGGDFGIFLPDAPAFDAATIAKHIAADLGRLAAEEISVTDNIAYVGAATYTASVSLGRMLSEADLALSMARQTGPNGWNVRSITEETDAMPLGQQKWKEVLEQSLAERKFSHDAQPVVTMSDRNKLLHLEVFSRIVLEGNQLLSAGVFMSLAERLSLVSSIDRIAIEEVMKLDRSLLPTESVAVNVSPASLQDEAFRAWITLALKNLPKSAPRLIFEFSEYSAVQNLELVRDFSRIARDNGHATGLDHYGQSFSNLGYLKSMRPDYVKIDRAYTGELKERDNDSRFYIASLCSVAHSIDVLVIAEGVETEQQVQVLKELNVDAIQGYLVARPSPIRDMVRKS
ncbi:diguanylate cyclase (GGDEF) domain-containing protein [Desulfonatronum thiosulfatophilum]|uniref:Diguanylate cyclase (GGDEF) domain-containing protein n=1 Tax=Desulfonatronum thiosulfatophilum TaxID=617002 RepID=A0A1G6CMI9_9BACT|nr:EAL domain-containing protein [Desulfonatronum thiosulfatophilum]SDB34097.1 diguanylate cyclase (GGDEF) domain-containing protein [Desulfonatronum thiosulfatophilum]